MSAPIRAASASPFAAARPLVQSRRVSLRVGSFGVTYATDKVLWSAEAAKTYTASDPPPVDPSPQIESERPQNQTENGTFPLDMAAARKRQLWADAQRQARRQADGPAPESSSTSATPASDATDPTGATVATSAAAANDSAQQTSSSPGARTDRTGGTGPAEGRSPTLVQAMRQATRAYLACATNLGANRPMLQAIA